MFGADSPRINCAVRVVKIKVSELQMGTTRERSNSVSSGSMLSSEANQISQGFGKRQKIQTD